MAKIKKIVHLAVVLALVLSFSLMMAVPVAAQTTYYVDDDGSDGDTGGSGDPWQSITYALTQVSAGDTIIVEEGTYDTTYETFPLTINFSLTLQASGNDPADFEINAEDTDAVFDIDLDDDDVTIDGFLITGGSGGATGINVNTVANGSTLTISNSDISNNAGVGIYIGSVDASTVTIEDNNVSDNSDDGIYFAGDVYDSSVTIDGNTVTDNDADGIDFEDIRGTSVVMITDNSVTGSDGNGLIVDDIYDDANVRIRDNDLSYNEGEGLDLDGEIYDDATVTVTGNTISNSLDNDGIENEDGIYGNATLTIDNNDISDNFDEGIDFDATIGNNSTVTITNNTISGNDSEGIDFDYYFQDDAMATVEDNTITNNNGNGIEIWWVQDDATITIASNTISDNDNNGVDIDMDADNMVTVSGCNDIFDNTGLGVFNHSGYDVDATENWWGDASGPGGRGSGTGDAVSEDVDYDPWLTAPCGERPAPERESGEDSTQTQAALSVQNVQLEPNIEVMPGQEIRFYADVSNNGDRSGRMMLEVMINGELDQSQMVNVRAGSVQRVVFYTYRAAPGVYTVSIGNNSAQFRVLSPPQQQQQPPPEAIFVPVDEGPGTGGIIALSILGLALIAGIVWAFRAIGRP